MPITVDGKELKCLKSFQYPGSKIQPLLAMRSSIASPKLPTSLECFTISCGIWSKKVRLSEVPVVTYPLFNHNRWDYRETPHIDKARPLDSVAVPSHVLMLMLIKSIGWGLEICIIHKFVSQILGAMRSSFSKIAAFGFGHFFVPSIFHARHERFVPGDEPFSILQNIKGVSV